MRGRSSLLKLYQQLTDSQGMSRNIALKGPQTSPLILFNRTASKAAAFAKTITAEKPQAAIVAPSPSAAVKDADITFICVGDDPALDQIIDTITSDTSISLKDKIIVDCSTVHPDTSRRTHATLASHGASFIACPVFGAPNAADAGQMVVIPAGSPASIDKIRPFLDGVTSKATLDLGPESEKDVGRATLLKVLGNTFILNTVETLAEGLVAAEKSGLGTKAYAEWVSTMFPGPFAKYAERMSSGEYFKREEPLFAVDLARKDLRHAANLAESSGMTLKSVKVTDDYLKIVKEEKGEKGDIAAVYGAIRKEAGLPFDNE
jgi:3-hydroxyisobutyrate dehydrogenase-like beta-hydroxyacid dehydrogenase